MVGPLRVVIAGGIAAAGDLLLDPARRTVRERVSMMPIDQVEIVLAQLGANAGVVGAELGDRGRRNHRKVALQRLADSPAQVRWRPEST
jgi:predicted NBD/HSP70 family sugar kinase